MATAHDIQGILAQLGTQLGTRRGLRIADGGDPAPVLDPAGEGALSLGWPEVDAVLPDHGLPRGVIELAAPHALAGSTSVAIAAVKAGQARGAACWCAWLDPEATLHAPALVAAGIALDRLLVVRPHRSTLARTSVKVVASGAFEIVVIDIDAVGPANRAAPLLDRVDRGAVRGAGRSGAQSRRTWPLEVVVRKLALAAETSGTTVLLLADGSKPRALPWPVALRIDLARPSPDQLILRVAKDKRGRVGCAKTVAFHPRLRAAG